MRAGVSILACILVLGTIVAAAVARADCGDGRLDVGERCDDGNRFGGDGCAENCTRETTRPLEIDPERSIAVTQLKAFKLTINISGTINFVFGEPGENGIIPVVVRSQDVRFPPIPVPGLACVCIRSDEIPEDFGPGNVARGSLDCSDSGAALSDFWITQDHITNDVDPDCASGRIESENEPHPGTCVGERRFNFEFNGPRGSMALADNISITQIPDGGLCDIDLGMFEKGPDGVPCSDDDPLITPGQNVPVTTGLAATAVFDADNVPGSTIAPGEMCGGSPCIAELRGKPFDCTAILGSQTGGMETGELAMAFPILHNPGAGDAAVTVLISPLQAPRCEGDCDGDGQVAINELVLGVNIALGTTHVSACVPMDADGSGGVEINELVRAVANALSGCPQAGRGQSSGLPGDP